MWHWNSIVSSGVEFHYHYHPHRHHHRPHGDNTQSPPPSGILCLGMHMFHEEIEGSSLSVRGGTWIPLAWWTVYIACALVRLFVRLDIIVICLCVFIHRVKDTVYDRRMSVCCWMMEKEDLSFDILYYDSMHVSLPLTSVISLGTCR